MERRTRHHLLAAAAVLGLGAVLLPFVARDAVVQDPDVQDRDQPDPVSAVPVDSVALPGRRAPDPLWRTAGRDAPGRIPDFPQEWSTEGRLLVDVSGAVAAAPGWRVGDRLPIDVPQLGARYESVIERIDEGLGHSRSAVGLMAGTDGGSRRFVLTVGPARVFAYIDTPDGPYELTANDRLGWLLPSSSMMAGLDYSKPDYWLPERDERTGGER